MTDKSRNILRATSEYGKRLFNFIKGKVTSEADAEDILQDVWYQLSNIDDIDEIDQLGSWLFRVARNKIIDRGRKKTEEFIDDLEFNDGKYWDDEDEFNIADIFIANIDSAEFVYIKDLFWQELFAALDDLPQKQKEVFVWNELEDKTLQQIADETGENLKTIISRKGYAVKYLRTRLQALYDEFLEY